MGAMNHIGESTIGAVNSIGTTTMGAVNSIGTTTMGAVNSAMTPFTNSNIFKNVHNSKNTSTHASNNHIFTNVTNSSTKNLSVNASSTKGGWGTLFGVFLLFIGIFFVSMIVFKDQISAAWAYIVNSIQTALHMNPPPVQSPDQAAATQTGQVSSPMPTTLDATYQATQNNIVSSILSMGGNKEVFNVSSNEYSFYDAEPLCRALGAELATYDQVQAAWNKGADWCNYGWTKGQVAIYPTQQVTWEKLQGGPPDEHTACGKPGVNGGFFDNPEMKFGVNCYGVKPLQNSNDERILMENGVIPKTVSTLKIDQQISDIKNNIDMVGVLPFNSQGWSSS